MKWSQVCQGSPGPFGWRPIPAVRWWIRSDGETRGLCQACCFDRRPRQADGWSGPYSEEEITAVEVLLA